MMLDRVVRLFCEVKESFDCGPVQIVTMLFAIIRSLRKSISAARKGFDVFFDGTKRERSGDPLALAFLEFDYEAKK